MTSWWVFSQSLMLGVKCLVVDLDKALPPAFGDGPVQRYGNEKQPGPGVVPEERQVQHRSLVLLILFGEERGDWWRGEGWRNQRREGRWWTLPSH